MKSAWIVLPLVALSAGMAWAASSPFGAMGGLSGLSTSTVPVNIQAGNMEYNRARNLITATDHVVITREDEELRADNVQVNTVTYDVEARGNVVFTKQKNVWRGDHMRYNYASGAWQTGDFDAMFEPFHVKAGAAEMTNKTEYVLKDAVVTTCTNGQSDWHYSFSCSTLKVAPKDRMVGRHAVIRLGGIPVFYLPIWYRSLGDRSVGFSVEAGYRKRMGLFLLTSTKYWISPVLRGATQVDYRSKRGPAIGQEVGWELGKDGGNGRAYVYYLNDDGVSSDDHYQNSPLIDSQRYRLRFQHSQTFSSRDYLLADVSYLSDPFVMEDFFDDEYRNAYQPQNFIAATHRGDDWTLGLSVHKRLNDFYTAIDRVPEITLDINRQQIEGTPFYYESRNALAYLSKVNDASNAVDDYSVGRLDTSHMFYWPTRSFGFLTLMPRAGFRATYYSDTVERHSVTQVVTVVTTNVVTGTGGGVTPVVSSGSQTNVQQTTTPLGSDVRALVELGLESSFRAFKVLSSEENAFGSGLRHVVEPYANYTFIPEPNLRPDNLYQFDSVDRVDKQNTVAMGVRNQLQTKHGSSVDDIMDLDLFTTYDLEDDENQPFSVFGMKSEFRLASWCQLFMDGTYDSYDSEINTFNTRVHVASGIWKADAENRYRRGDSPQADASNLLTANVSVAPSRNWEFGIYDRYEIEEARLEEQGLFVTRTLDCLAFKVGGSYLPGYTRTDGSTQDDDFRVSFQMWLTALPNVRLGNAPRN